MHSLHQSRHSLLMDNTVCTSIGQTQKCKRSFKGPSIFSLRSHVASWCHGRSIMVPWKRWFNCRSATSWPRSWLQRIASSSFSEVRESDCSTDCLPSVQSHTPGTISGIWGIYFYREVQKQAIIARWFASALVTIAGILLLGYESSPADPDSDASTALNVSIVDS